MNTDRAMLKLVQSLPKEKRNHLLGELVRQRNQTSKQQTERTGVAEYIDPSVLELDIDQLMGDGSDTGEMNTPSPGVETVEYDPYDDPAFDHSALQRDPNFHFGLQEGSLGEEMTWVPTIDSESA